MSGRCNAEGTGDALLGVVFQAASNTERTLLYKLQFEDNDMTHLQG
jgi:hypothetical protein